MEKIMESVENTEVLDNLPEGFRLENISFIVTLEKNKKVTLLLDREYSNKEELIYSIYRGRKNNYSDSDLDAQIYIYFHKSGPTATRFTVYGKDNNIDKETAIKIFMEIYDRLKLHTLRRLNYMPFTYNKNSEDEFIRIELSNQREER